MRQILLAISGKTPSKKAFRFAVELSHRIRAQLSILRFIQNSKTVTAHLGRFLEDSFADVALAEENATMTPGKILQASKDPLQDLLKGTDTDIALTLALGSEDPDNDLERFVESHHDVILTILDAPGSTAPPEKKERRLEKLKKALRVPLVVVRPDTA